ncbi:MAG: thiamine phosphate synthase [Polyangiaceae bacterium]|nr:thiamine phosphate synthase [Polyangiaceae bacterium]
MNHLPQPWPLKPRGLYPLIDLDHLRKISQEPLGFARAVLVARPAVLQVRAKGTPLMETLGVLRALLPECRAAGALLFANDRPDLALLAECDGVHVGQEDLPIGEVRRLAQGLRVGVSTHSLAQLEAALALEPDYVAFGPVFSTLSKENPDAVVGPSELGTAYARAQAAGIPLVAIGGIDLARAQEIRQSTDMVAVIGALLGAAPSLAAVTEAARSFQRAFQ